MDLSPIKVSKGHSEGVEYVSDKDADWQVLSICQSQLVPLKIGVANIGPVMFIKWGSFRVYFGKVILLIEIVSVYPFDIWIGNSEDIKV